MSKDREMLNQFISESVDNLELYQSSLLQLEENPNDPELINAMFRAVHSIKGAASFFTFTELVELAHKAEMILDRIRKLLKSQSLINQELVSTLLKVYDAMQGIFKQIQTEGHDRIEETKPLIDTLVKLEKELELPSLNQESKPKARKRRELSSLQVEMLKKLGTAGQKVLETHNSSIDELLKIRSSTLDRIGLLAEELITISNKLHKASDSNSSYDSNLYHLQKLSGEVRDMVMQAKLQPLSIISSKLSRAVRDLALDLGKEVDFRIEGENTQLDKSIIDKLFDPILHMLRNALDHAMELPEERITVGKSREGSITFKAKHSGNQVHISIIDDGRGIDPDLIRGKAIEKGLYTREKINALNNEDALALIFEPGFSTKDSVSGISGRGVGMDVVKANVLKLNGDIEIISEKGKGTEIKIKVPLTLAITKAAIVKIADLYYAVPENIIRGFGTVFDTIDLNQEHYISRSNTQLPLILSRTCFDDNDKSRTFYQEVEFIDYLHIDQEGYEFAFAVDEIVEVSEIILKPLQAAFSNDNFYSGLTIVDNDIVALILDMSAIAYARGLQKKTNVEKINFRSNKVEESQVLALTFEINKQHYLCHLESGARILDFNPKYIKQSALGPFIAIDDKLVRLINLPEFLDSEDASFDFAKSYDYSLVFYNYQNNPLAIYLGENLELKYTQALVRAQEDSSNLIIGTAMDSNILYKIVDLNSLIKTIVDSSDRLMTNSDINSAINDTGQLFLTFSLRSFDPDLIFAIKLESIKEVIPARQVSQIKNPSKAVQGLINLRGEALISKNIFKILQINTAGKHSYENLVIRALNKSVSLQVEEVGELVELTKAQQIFGLSSLPERLLEIVDSAYKYENKIALVLDERKLVS